MKRREWDPSAVWTRTRRPEETVAATVTLVGRRHAHAPVGDAETGTAATADAAIDAILIARDPGLGEALGAYLTREGYCVRRALSIEEARALMGARQPDVLFVLGSARVPSATVRLAGELAEGVCPVAVLRPEWLTRRDIEGGDGSAAPAAAAVAVGASARQRPQMTPVPDPRTEVADPVAVAGG